MSEVHVIYLIPLVVSVDLDDGRVSEVHISDQDLGPVVEITDAADEDIFDSRPAAQALAIIDADQYDWPSWEIG